MTHLKTEECISEIYDIACVIQKLKKYIVRVMKFMQEHVNN